MNHYSEAAVERMMEVQKVIMRALANKIRWYEGAVHTSQAAIHTIRAQLMRKSSSYDRIL
jgi:hypothetical protein